MLCLDLHSIVYLSEVSGRKDITIIEEVLENVSDEGFKNISLTDKGRTMAYNIWHITRIEDICANILIADDNQVIETGSWQRKINSRIKDTGNALTAKEIGEFSQVINREELMNYRTAVGIKTREIIRKLSPEDMKRKMKPESLQRIIDEKSVSENPDAIWLMEFFGKKL